MNRIVLSLGVMALLVTSFVPNSSADETWFETKDGTTYRVTRRVEKVPVAETRTETRTERVHVTEYETEMREATKTVWVPVTQYVYQPRWHQWWNPFAEPYVTYEAQPITRWELRTQTVREPVTRRKDIPHEKIVQVPVRSLGFVERPFEERVAVKTIAPVNSPAPSQTAPQYADRPTSPTRTADLPRVAQPATTLGAPIRR